MAHHAYFVVGESGEEIQNAYAFIEAELGMTVAGNADVMLLKYGLFSVDDARALRALADLSPTAGSQKVLIISASRLFHEAQNALLKLFEEPPEGTMLILIIPSEGILLPTLRSRLLPLPNQKSATALTPEAQDFIASSKAQREKIIEKILTRAKSDKDDEKQAARLSAIHLVEGLVRKAHEQWQIETSPAKKKDLQLFLDDLNAFMPILHERSAPLKLIFEHMLITMPPLAK